MNHTVTDIKPRPGLNGALGDCYCECSCGAVFYDIYKDAVEDSVRKHLAQAEQVRA